MALGVHCALTVAGAVFTGSAVVAHADVQTIGSVGLAVTSLVLLLLPPVVRYEVGRLRAPIGSV